MFDSFVFPDGTSPNWDSVNWLQKDFMKWFNKERTKKPLTFPVETLNLLNDGKDYMDKEWADFQAEMYAEGHSFFTYTSDSVDSLASCCYSGDTKVLVKDANGAYLISFKDLENKKFDTNGYKIFNNGKWSKGKLVKLPCRDMYKITTSNNKTMIATDNHRNNCLDGVKLTKDITTDDYIMFNNTLLDTYPEKDENLTYEQGFTVGAFLGDGSFGTEMVLSNGDKCIYDVLFSLSKNKEWIIPIINKANSQLRGGNSCCSTYRDTLLATRVSSKTLTNFIIKWTNWKRGTYSHNKEVNLNCLLQSIDFRKGIVDGWYATDGNYNSTPKGNSLRGYTNSKPLLECIEAICTSLGYITSTNVDTRTEKPKFKGIEYNRNYPVYCLLKYQTNKQQKAMDNLCKFRDNSYYFKIKSKELIDYKDKFVYCFEMEDVEDDKFTLPNGIHNFNCRLKNKLQDNTFSFTLGAGGVSTGSKGVTTININRLVQNAVNNNRDISECIKEQVEKVHKYLIAYNEIVKDNFNSHMLSVYDAGYISLDKQYLTIGINGFVEGAEFLGIKISPNEEYFKYGEMILKPIYEANKSAKTKEIMFNTEFVPKMCGHKVV